jgi:pimeloyl-[acyl-carrier protein] methyl ester esterase
MKWILLPGMDGTGELFAPFLSVLPPEITPIVIAYNSHEKFSYEKLEEVVWRQLPNEPFVLIAESFSGPIAIRIAERNPKHLQAMVLCATFLEFPAGTIPKLLARICGPFLFHLQPPHWVLRSFLWNGGQKETEAIFLAAIAKVAPKVLADRLKSIVNLKFAEPSKKIAVPLLVLAATNDRLVSLHNAARLSELTGGATVEYLETPHLLLQTKPRHVCDLIQTFLSRNISA